MIIITDTAEQRNQHILQSFSDSNIKFKCKNLDFADYTFILDGESYENKIVIEKKNSLLELSGSICQGRKRFENEFTRATKAGAKVYLLVEEENIRDKLRLRRQYDKYIKKVDNKWVWIDNNEFPKINLKKALNKTWKSFCTANSMIASINAFKERYNLELVSCAKKETGKKIIEIFQNEIDKLIL